MAYDRRALTGVRGWLAFLVVTLGLNAIASLFAVIGSLIQAHLTAARPGLPVYFDVEAALFAGRAAGYGYLAWRLSTRFDAGTPRIAIAGLWLLALAGPVADVVAALLVLGATPYNAGYAFGTDIVRSAGYAAIWTAYLLRSERVRNTYGGEDEEVAAVFR